MQVDFKNRANGIAAQLYSAVAMDMALVLGIFAFIFGIFSNLPTLPTFHHCNINHHLAVAMGAVLLLGIFAYIL